ncbi:MAG: ABC transporter permease [Mucinivorans sp.]
MKLLFTIRQIIESLRFAMREVLINKMRTFLSLLGITIGIFAIISVFTLIDSLERYIHNNVESIGANVVYIGRWPWVSEDGGQGYQWWKYANRPQVSLAEFAELQHMLPSADVFALSITFSRTLQYGKQSLGEVIVIATTVDYDRTRKTELESGRFLTPQEFEGGSGVAVIGYTVAEELFMGDNPLGRDIKIGPYRATVVGVFKKEGENMYGMSYDKQVLVPLRFGQNFVNMRWADPELTIKSRPGIDMEDFKAEATSVIRRMRRQAPQVENNFAINEVSAITTQLDALFSMINLVGGIIGLFSILVGGFGVANIMFVSVRERTAQIGIQKALGARPYFILLQFVFEAVLLSVVGGAVGLLLIWVGTTIASAVSGFEIILTLKNIMIGLGISSVVGAVSGFFPAWSAAIMEPVEAIHKN